MPLLEKIGFGCLVLVLAACSTKGGGPAVPAGESPGRSMPGPGPRGAEISAASPVPPYFPSEPFEYRCKLVWTSDAYGRNPAEPRDSWYSSSIVILDNRKTSYSGSQIKWGHYYRRGTWQDKIPFSASAAVPPYPLDVRFHLNFSHPDAKGNTAVHLGLDMPLEKGATIERMVSTDASGNFSDLSISVALDSSLENPQTGDSTSLRGTATCTKKLDAPAPKSAEATTAPVAEP